ncbi:MAG: acylphosphatase [Patescibacteria group bacterium]
MFLRLRIYGKVQGVWYRASTAGVARDLGLEGFAKNLPGGAVEVVAVGPEAKLAKLRKWCEHGPAHAKVECIEEEWRAADEKFDGFAVI